MNIEDFRLLYEYDAWANHRILDSCAALSEEQFTRDLQSSFPPCATHSFTSAGRNGYGSNAGTAARPPLFRTRPIIQSRIGAAAIRGSGPRSAGLHRFAHAEDLQRVITFKRITGEPFSQPLWQCLQHVANHSTYHRGQIATMLRQLGAKPVSTDLAIFYRDGPSARPA